jgi:hypothetical protein
MTRQGRAKSTVPFDAFGGVEGFPISHHPPRVIMPLGVSRAWRSRNRVS